LKKDKNSILNPILYYNIPETPYLSLKTLPPLICNLICSPNTSYKQTHKMPNPKTIVYDISAIRRAEKSLQNTPMWYKTILRLPLYYFNPSLPL
jgi:hypothetical protein